MQWFFKKIIPIVLLTPFYLILGVFIYFAILSEFPPVEAKVIDWQPKTLAAGDEIKVTYDVKHYRDCAYHTIRKMIKIEPNNVKGNIITIGYVERYIKAGEQEGPQEVVFSIPLIINDGVYDLYAEIQPVCNFYDYIINKTLPIIPLRVTINNMPAEVVSMTISKDKLKVGEDLNIENTVNKKRACNATIDTFVTLRDNTIVTKFSRPGAVGSLGIHTTKEILDPGVPPGEYLLKRTLSYDCPLRAYQISYE